MTRLLPRFVVRGTRRLKLALEDRRNATRSPGEVFSEIYRQRKWGGTGPFPSGDGSATDSIVGPYVDAVCELLRSYRPEKPRVVDLGCGNFCVGSQLIADCSSYVGVDVVPELVEHLQASSGSEHVRFLCLDIVKDELPAGDICLIRQVFQHLSNEQIARVLAKLDRYRTVLVTEHHPQDGPSVVPNRDQVHGSGIRLYRDSGVYLDRPPFDVSRVNLELVLEVPSHRFEGVSDPGVIRTFRMVFPTIAPEPRARGTKCFGR